jgi:hypothetical protein
MINNVYTTKNGLLEKINIAIIVYNYVGPKSKRSISFDRNCIYGNDMCLTAKQVEYLVQFCNGLNEHDHFKVYLFRMTNSSVIKKKCKMVG